MPVFAFVVFDADGQGRTNGFLSFEDWAPAKAFLDSMSLRDGDTLIAHQFTPDDTKDTKWAACYKRNRPLFF